MRSTLSTWVVVCLCLATLGARSSLAQTPAAASATPEEILEVRARYGGVVRNGSQIDALGPGLRYTGFTPNDFALQGWRLLFDVVGLTASVQREGFGLYSSQGKVTSGGLLRAHVGPTGRLRLGLLRLEAVVAYAFHQLPDFGNSAVPLLRPATRHGLLLGARVLADIGRVTLEARGEYPLSLATTDATKAVATSPGFTAGAGVRVELFRLGRTLWGVMADGSYTADTLSNDAITSTQRLIRFGLALDVQLKDEAVVLRNGSLLLSVSSATGEPLPTASVTVDAASGPVVLTLDATGQARAAEVLAGPVAAHATLAGYEPADANGVIVVGVETPLRLTLKKLVPKTGGLKIAIVDKGSKNAIPNAKVTAAGKTVLSDASGKVTISDLAAGPLGIEVSAEDYQPGSDAASVVAGVDSEITIELLLAKKRELATITGLVRSRGAGAPIQANLEIPEAQIKTRANEKGAFIFRLVGGTYTVTISAKGFVSQTKQLTVKDAEQAILNVDLQPK